MQLRGKLYYLCCIVCYGLGKCCISLNCIGTEQAHGKEGEGELVLFVVSCTRRCFFFIKAIESQHLNIIQLILDTNVADPKIFLTAPALRGPGSVYSSFTLIGIKL
jgi:hypothetical protein